MSTCYTLLEIARHGPYFVLFKLKVTLCVNSCNENEPYGSFLREYNICSVLLLLKLVGNINLYS